MENITLKKHYSFYLELMYILLQVGLPVRWVYFLTCLLFKTVVVSRTHSIKDCYIRYNTIIMLAPYSSMLMSNSYIPDDKEQMSHLLKQGTVSITSLVFQGNGTDQKGAVCFRNVFLS